MNEEQQATDGGEVVFEPTLRPALPMFSIFAVLGIATVCLGLGGVIGYFFGQDRAGTPVMVSAPPVVSPPPSDSASRLYRPDRDSPMVAKEASERQYTPDLNGLSVPKVSFGDGPVGEAPPVMEGSLMPLPAGDPSLESVPLDPILAESELRVAISAVGGEVVERRDLPDDAGFSLAAQLDGSRVKELAKRAQMAVQSVIVSELPTRTVPRPGSPEALQLREIENRLNAAKKRRDQARIDFVPEAPILRDLDDEIAGLMKEIQEIQRKISKVATVMLVVRTRRQDPLKLVEPKSENPPLNF